MTSLQNIWFFKIAHFVELNRSYQPAKFHWPRLFGSNFTRAGGKHPSPDLHALKKPSPYRVKRLDISFCGNLRTRIILTSRNNENEVIN